MTCILENLEFSIQDFRDDFAKFAYRTDDYSEIDKAFDSMVRRISWSAFNLGSNEAKSNQMLISQQNSENHEFSIKLPKYLTDVQYVSQSSILYRDDIICAIINQLLSHNDHNHAQKNNILITGFGGLGKTSIARVLYSKLLDAVNSGIYDSIGWIDYNINLKNSILNANIIKLYETEKDPEKRWDAIKKRLLSNESNQKTLLFIDNVGLSQILCKRCEAA
jgi:DNA replication protein DnaC